MSFFLHLRITLPFSSWAPMGPQLWPQLLLSQLSSPPFHCSAYRNPIILTLFSNWFYWTLPVNHPIPWLPLEPSLLVLFLPFDLPVLRIFQGLLLSPSFNAPSLRSPSSAPFSSLSLILLFQENCLPGQNSSHVYVPPAISALPYCAVDLKGSCICSSGCLITPQSQHVQHSLSPWPPKCASSLKFPISVTSVPIYRGPQAKRAPSAPPPPWSSPPTGHQVSIYLLNFPKIHPPLSIPTASSFLTWTFAKGPYHHPCLPLSSFHSFFTYDLSPKIQTWSYSLLEKFHGRPRTFWIRSKLLGTNRKILYHLGFLPPPLSLICK